MTIKSKIKIFLAHANEDKEQVIGLYNRIKNAGYTPWLDKVDLLPGQNWQTEITSAIRESHIFIACLSRKSVSKQGYVQKEFRLALNKYAELPPGTIYLIPLRLDECDVPNIRLSDYGIALQEIHWLDYWDANGFSNFEKAIEYQFGPFDSDDKIISTVQPPIEVQPIDLDRRLPPQTPFTVGDIVEQYQHYDFDSDTFLKGADSDQLGTTWKVLKITNDFVELILVSGKYQWISMGKEYYPGYVDTFVSCENYKSKHRQSFANEQILKEYRKI